MDDYYGELWFPDPNETSKEGLLAFGGDLSIERLLLAYRSGIFPWYNEGDPIMWYSPDPRMILFPEKFKVSKSLRKTLRSEDRKSTRLNSSHVRISYAVFCLK